MCDERTLQDMDQTPDAGALSRRSFALLGAAAAMASYGAANAATGKAAALHEAMVAVRTPDGKADCFFVHPARGRHPGIVMWPDIAGLREANKLMARRIAAQGFAVLVVNPYYRSAPAPVMTSFAEWRTPEGQAKVAPMRARLTTEATTRDAAALVAWLDRHAAVDGKRGIGTNGYCMGGALAVCTAVAVPGRVRAVASLHGALVSDAADSPHRLMARTRARFLVAIARNDAARAPEESTAIKAAAAKAGPPAEVEVYAADHGWTVPDSPAYDKGEGDRAFSRMMALFASL